MNFDLQQAQALITEADRRRREAPTNRRELEGWLLYAVGLPIASCYPVEPNTSIPPVDKVNGLNCSPKERFMWLWQNDPTFHHTVKFAINNVMVILDDYARATGRRID